MRESLARFTVGLTHEASGYASRLPPSLGFHLKHIAGSVDRLSTYLSGAQITDEQLSYLKQESQPDVDLPGLIDNIEKSLRAAEEILSVIDPAALYEDRFVGRQRLPSTVIGLIVHLAEHTQRHLGQAITTAQMLRGQS